MVGSCVPASLRTATCSGRCAAVAETSAWPPTSSTRSTQLGPRSSEEPSRGGPMRPPRCSRCTHELVSGAAPELTCVAALRMAPPAPWLSKDVHGQPIVALFVCHSGSVEDGEKALQRSRRSARRWATRCNVGRTCRSRLCSMRPSPPAVATTGSPSTCRGSTRRFLPPRQACFGDAVAAFGHPDLPARRCAQSTADRSLGGGNRDAAGVVNVASSWDHAKDDRVNIEWAPRGMG